MVIQTELIVDQVSFDIMGLVFLLLTGTSADMSLQDLPVVEEPPKSFLFRLKLFNNLVYCLFFSIRSLVATFIALLIPTQYVATNP